MHISPTASPTPQHAPEPPRPAQQDAQVSSRPVVAPTQNEATAQETRRNDARRAERDSDRHDAVHNKRSDSKNETESKSQAEPSSRRNADPAVGSSVNVFA